MSQKVGELLSEHGIIVGNKPMGLWRYEITEDTIPTIPKFCGVFETLGERRVSSHLLPGLEALVSQFFPSVTEGEVWCLFPPERRGGEEITPTWSACCTGANKVILILVAPGVHVMFNTVVSIQFIAVFSSLQSSPIDMGPVKLIEVTLNQPSFCYSTFPCSLSPAVPHQREFPQASWPRGFKGHSVYDKPWLEKTHSHSPASWHWCIGGWAGKWARSNEV